MVYVAGLGNNDPIVVVIDAAQNKVVDSFIVGPCGVDCYYGVYDLAVSPDGSRLYLSREDGLVFAVDTATRSEVGWIHHRPECKPRRAHHRGQR